MSPSHDPFGFRVSRPSRNARATTVIAQPGQEIRILVRDERGSFRGFPGDSRASPSGRGDSRASPRGSGDSRSSPRGSGDSRSSPKGSGDSRSSPKGSGDVFGPDPFGFRAYPHAFSPSPVTIVAEPGQEIRVLIADEAGAIPSGMLDSRSSPKGSGDSRSSPKGSG